MYSNVVFNYRSEGGSDRSYGTKIILIKHNFSRNSKKANCTDKILIITTNTQIIYFL